MPKELFQNKIFWACSALLIVIVAALLLGVQLWINGRSSAVEKIVSTDVVHYTPSATDLPETAEEGSCFANSAAYPYRADAWRCSVGNSISDPCFQIAGSSELICNPDPLDPSSSSTFALKLTAPLPKVSVVSTTAEINSGWMLELVDGTICTPFTGTLPFSSEGDVAYYSCNSSKPNEQMIFNSLDSKTNPWTAEIGELALSSGFPPPLEDTSTIGIKIVWQ